MVSGFWCCFVMDWFCLVDLGVCGCGVCGFMCGGLVEVFLVWVYVG